MIWRGRLLLLCLLLIVTFGTLGIAAKAQTTDEDTVSVFVDVPTPIPSSVTFAGRAYPDSVVTLMRDGFVVAEVPAGSDASFQITIDGLSKASYVFALYTQDSEGRRSATESYPIFVGRAVSILVDGIFLSPTTDVDNEYVRQGEIIQIFGQSTPNAEIMIEISPGVFVTTTTDDNGVFLYNFDTSVLDLGVHDAKSRASVLGSYSEFGLPVDFTVATVTIPKDTTCGIGDLNCDGRVNLVDFSIAAFWYRRDLSDDFKLIESERLNDDGVVNLVDFSIMAFYWTG